MYTRQDPFSSYKNGDGVHAFLDALFNAVRPHRPTESEAPQLTDFIWEVMESCWAPNTKKRPSVALAAQRLRELPETVSADTCSD